MGIQERKEREKDRRRQQIIVAAKRVFSEKGFNKSTMEDIANEAELSPGTLYLYFKNKEELYASLSLRILQYLNIRVEHVKKETELSPDQKLEKLIEAMYDVYDFDSRIQFVAQHTATPAYYSVVAYRSALWTYCNRTNYFVSSISRIHCARWGNCKPRNHSH